MLSIQDIELMLVDENAADAGYARAVEALMAHGGPRVQGVPQTPRRFRLESDDRLLLRTATHA